MSKNISTLLQKYPLITTYANAGLVNLNALARLIQPNTKSVSIEALGMELRRYLAKQEKTNIPKADFSSYDLEVVSRSNIKELIFDKTITNRKYCLKLATELLESKHFFSLVEGEKEITIITDADGKIVERSKPANLHQTEKLGFISINFPFELRAKPGIYSVLTSALAEEHISIQSFHTIGGEIIILVHEQDLIKTQEIFQSFFN